MLLLELKKNAKKDFTALKKIRVALLGDSSTQFLSQALRGYGYEVGLDLNLFEAGHNQVDRQIHDSSSELYQFVPDFVIVFHSSQKLLDSFYRAPLDSRRNFASDHLEKLGTLVQILNRNLTNTKLIVFNFVEINDAVFGNFANKINVSFLHQIRDLNVQLMEYSQQIKNLLVCDVSALSNLKGAEFSFEPRLYVDADMVFSLDFLPLVAKNILDLIQASSGVFKKCLVVDLDNTIWGGVIGDDGIENIEIGDLGQGKAFSALQHWIKALKERGILLAACSKNETEIAKQPFRDHPDMVLSLDDFAVFAANWESKVENIKQIRAFLNIGYDSMVFLDDNPYERGLMRSHFPEICVPELPPDPSDYLQHLRSLNLFETTSFTEEDQQRTLQYQQETIRGVAQKSFTDEKGFLASLEMKCEVRPFTDFNTPRVTQLIQRSNQFNLRSVRYTEQDIQAISRSPMFLPLSFNLDDKFGSYGLVSVVIGREEGDYLFIDTWVMSCRVLKRGLEEFVLNEIVADAKRRGARLIKGEYVATPKNALVRDHYSRLGFHEDNGGHWYLDVASYSPKLTFIRPELSAETCFTDIPGDLHVRISNAGLQ